ncbi:MAG: Trp family transcriptional regulator [Kiritimatiellia bacterium]
MRNKNKFDKGAFNRFCRVLSTLSTPDEVEKLFMEVLTEKERLDVALRWHLMELLNEGVSQRKIAELLGVSLCKITRGSKILKDKMSITREKLKNASEHGGRSSLF